ncbi:MAG: hypothetical protein L6Q71_12355, partial [Planctomycetes bacterium]|nr:hypothetical protein [Planctomycetota bacterium]
MKNVIQSLIARKLAPVVLVFALLPVALRAQDTPAAPARDVIDESVIAAEIKRRYPHIELNGKHDIRAVRDPETEDERHTYTVDMIDVVRIWINTGQGAILEKILDAALDDHKDHAVLEFISGYFAFNFPLGLGKNVKNVEQHYRKALKIVEEREQDYAAARTQLALYLVAAGKASEAREQIDLAAARAPNYGEALLLQASVYLSLVKNPEKATAICKQFLALNPEDERQYDKGVQLLREASVQFNNEYESFLNSAYASDIKGVRRARIAVRLAELLIERKEFEKAMELGREALASFEPEQAPLLRMLALGKMAAGAGQLAAKADEEKRAEDAAQFEQQVEVYLREMVELDLKYLTLTDPEKGVAPNSGLFKLTQLLVKRGRAKDAVDV